MWCAVGSPATDVRLAVDLTTWEALKADYWTCNVRFASGIPVYDRYDGWPDPSRVCRGVTPLFFGNCLRCGMPRGWEKRKPGKVPNPAWRPA